MNQKEVSELRRRFRPEKNAIRRIYGCYVNSKKEIISYLDIPLGTAPQEEVEQYFQLLKKALSGTLGKQLIDMIFSTQQVADSPEHRLLSALYRSGLKDSAAREEFYQKVIQSLDFEGRNYVILLAHDTYDVPHQEGSGEDGTEDTVFSYFLCAICPVKDGKRELGYCPGEHEFHSQIPGQIISPPELGFLFPAFDNRTANLYNALFYTRTPSMLYHDFLDAVFHTEPPMSAAEQREAFQSALCNGLGEGCSIDVIHAVHEQLWEKLEEHKSCGDPEPLALTPQALGHVLQDCGVPQTQ
ncbi:MAG: DUF4317 family protein, partial [Oscillospiraceae bacterium]|nr:DUF4317 family protein [Oscillospiraceae bacterium]